MWVNRMPTRRLTRTLDRPASCPMALLAPYSAATRIGALKSVGTASNYGIRVSISNRRGINAQVRRNVLSVSPRTTTRSVSTEQSSRGEECQTSTRDQGEQPDGRVHRRTRCRKRQRAANAPRFNGSVLPAYVERSRYVCPAEPYRPSRLLMRHSGGLLYVPKDL